MIIYRLTVSGTYNVDKYETMYFPNLKDAKLKRKAYLQIHFVVAYIDKLTISDVLSKKKLVLAILNEESYKYLTDSEFIDMWNRQ